MDELKLLPLRRLRASRRIDSAEVTGLSPTTEFARDEARDAVSEGGGSLDFADWTLSSRLFILPIRPRIWYNDPDLGIPEGRLATLLVFVVLFCLGRLGREVTDEVERPVLKAKEVARECVANRCVRGPYNDREKSGAAAF
jgi:hypothetical protein